MEWKMDIWKYYYVTHKYHVVCNPMSIVKIDELFQLLKLEPGAYVLDIACGMAEILTRLAEQFEVSGVGVDISPYFVPDAKQKLQERAPDARIEVINMDGANYKPERLFDLTMCIGASWIYQGHRGTLRALKSMTKPNGLVLTGEPFWLQEPSEAYLAAEICLVHTTKTYSSVKMRVLSHCTQWSAIRTIGTDMRHFSGMQQRSMLKIIQTILTYRRYKFVSLMDGIIICVGVVIRLVGPYICFESR